MGIVTLRAFMNENTFVKLTFLLNYNFFLMGGYVAMFLDTAYSLLWQSFVVFEPSVFEFCWLSPTCWNRGL